MRQIFEIILEIMKVQRTLYIEILRIAQRGGNLDSGLILIFKTANEAANSNDYFSHNYKLQPLR